MNIPQRIVLIVGVLLLWIIVLNAKTYHAVDYSQFPAWAVDEKTRTLGIQEWWAWDREKALVRGGLWCITVAAVYFAVGKRKQ